MHNDKNFVLYLCKYMSIIKDFSLFFKCYAISYSYIIKNEIILVCCLDIEHN